MKFDKYSVDLFALVLSMDRDYDHDYDYNDDSDDDDIKTIFCPIFFPSDR